MESKEKILYPFLLTRTEEGSTTLLLYPKLKPIRKEVSDVSRVSINNNGRINGLCVYTEYLENSKNKEGEGLKEVYKDTEFADYRKSL